MDIFVKTIVLLLICWNGINASDTLNLCKYESLIDSLGNRAFIGCKNSQLISMSIQGKNWSDYWIFILKEKEIGNGELYFILTESYKMGTGLKFVPTDSNLFSIDSIFFQKGRTVFLRINKFPRDTILQLSSGEVSINDNIKFTERLQKVDIFTSDSIKIPNFYISRRDMFLDISIAMIESFYIRLINNEIIIQFEEFRPDRYRFLLPEERTDRSKYIEYHQYKFGILHPSR
jgi:hypothetical protein